MQDSPQTGHSPRPGRQLIDVHAHVLPGLDDGPTMLEDSLRMCSSFAQQGVGVVVAAPHMNHPRFRVTAQAVRRRVARLQAACRSRRLALRVLPGGEVYLQPGVIGQLDRASVLTMADRGRHLLLELPPDVVPPLERLIFALRLRQITPVLSHPERHGRLSRRPGLLEELVGRGCLVQITSGALLGAFGPVARQAAELFLERDLVHLVASDAHSPDGTSRPRFAELWARLVELVGMDGARRLLSAGPAAIIGGQMAGEHGVDERPAGMSTGRGRWRA